MPSDLEDVLTKEGPGGIPAWGYGVGLAALILAVEWLRNRKASQADTSNQAAPGTTTVTTTDSGGGYYPYPWMPFYTIPGTNSPAPMTNSQWLHLSEDWLEAQGFEPGRVSDALNDYLDGQGQDRENRKLVDLATDQFGKPPESTGNTQAANLSTNIATTSAMDEADTGDMGPGSVTGAGVAAPSGGSGTNTPPAAPSPPSGGTGGSSGGKDKDRKDRDRRRRR